MIEFLNQFDQFSCLVGMLVGAGGVAGIVLLLAAVVQGQRERQWHQRSDEQDRFWY